MSAKLWLIIMLVLALDIGSKSIATSVLTYGMPWPSANAPARLRLAHNPDLLLGGTLPGGGVTYTALGGAIIAGLLWVVTRLPARARDYTIAFGLLIGGSAGNVLERVWRGHVVDFLDLGAGSFNLADVALGLGALLYLFLRYRDGIREERWNWRSLWSLWPIPHVLPPSLRARAEALPNEEL